MKSLHTRLTLALCVSALVLLTLGGCVMYFSVKKLLEANFDAVLAAKADALLTTAEVENGKVRTDFEVQEFAGFGSAAGGDYYEFRTPDGKMLARSPSLRRDRLAPPLAQPSRRPLGSYMTLPDGREGRALWQSTPLETKDGAPDLVVELGVASDSITLRQTLHTLAGVLIATAGFGLIVTVVCFQHVLGHSLKPVGKMAREVHEIDVENGRHMLGSTDLPTELVPVGLKINDLLVRARRAMDRERSFSSHAAHELRTPLAELRAMTDLMGMWTDEVTPARCEEMQGAISTLEGLLQKLSLLAKADAGQQPIQREKVNLESTLHSAVQRFSEVAERKDLTLHANTAGDDIFTDPVLWEAIVNNLLENAVNYAPTGSSIRVEASASRLAVSNEAPNLTPADMDRLTDRFWRKDTGHTAESQSHSGLGLALVSAYARLLGGRSEFSLDPKGTFTATLIWDLAAR